MVFINVALILVLHGVILRIFSIVLAWAIQPPFRRMSKGGELWKSGEIYGISLLFLTIG